MIKAYRVEDRMEGIGVIVFHLSPSKAKYFAHTHVEHECSAVGDDWIRNLVAKRLPQADSLMECPEPHIIDGSTKEGAEKLRSLGWYCYEYSTEQCSSCGLHPWPEVPESDLEYKGDSLVCKGCKNNLKNNG